MEFVFFFLLICLCIATLLAIGVVLYFRLEKTREWARKSAIFAVLVEKARREGWSDDKLADACLECNLVYKYPGHTAPPPSYVIGEMRRFAEEIGGKIQPDGSIKKGKVFFEYNPKKTQPAA